MTVKVHESSRVGIDLTQVPYFPAQPLVLREASALERVRETPAVVDTDPGYHLDRHPHADNDAMFFGGLGLASVMDVSAHPLRARARRINVLTAFAVAAVLAVGLVMVTVVMTFRH